MTRETGNVCASRMDEWKVPTSVMTFVPYEIYVRAACTYDFINLVLTQLRMENTQFDTARSKTLEQDTKQRHVSCQ